MLVSALSLRGFRLSPSTTSDRDSLNFDTVCRISRMSLTVSCTLRTESVTFALYLRRSLWACSLVKRGTFGRCEAQSLRIIASLAPSALRWRIHIFMRLRSEALWSCSSTLFSIRVISSSGSSACHFASRSPWRMSLSFCLHHFPQKSGVLTAARQDAPLGKSSAMSSTPSSFLSRATKLLTTSLPRVCHMPAVNSVLLIVLLLLRSSIWNAFTALPAWSSNALRADMRLLTITASSWSSDAPASPSSAGPSGRSPRRSSASCSQRSRSSALALLAARSRPWAM
mmetsp:Transcript_7125/g.20085  ORF Transcript_7125/g.20085 Transcript_7125/m.20085 type:complete len:284 (-) Transcript_7125:145-996(-)